MTDKTIKQDYDESQITWDGSEIIPAVKTLGSPPALGNGAGLASTLRTWIMSLAGLADLRDTDIAGSPSPQDGDRLTYRAATQKWIASPATATTTSLAALTDTDLAGSPRPAD